MINRGNFRSLVGALLSLGIFGVGYWLAFHTTRFMNTTTPDGAPFAPYAKHFEQVADMLMYSGLVMGIVTVGVWMLHGNQRGSHE